MTFGAVEVPMKEVLEVGAVGAANQITARISRAFQVVPICSTAGSLQMVVGLLEQR